MVNLRCIVWRTRVSFLTLWHTLKYYTYRATSIFICSRSSGVHSEKVKIALCIGRFSTDHTAYTGGVSARIVVEIMAHRLRWPCDRNLNHGQSAYRILRIIVLTCSEQRLSKCRNINGRCGSWSDGERGVSKWRRVCWVSCQWTDSACADSESTHTCIHFWVQ